jgi:hypothetical protein
MAILVVVLGVVSLALGGFFVKLGFEKADLITQQMVAQEITYGGAGGDIVGIIDTPQEAQVMADILQEHSKELGNYSQLARDDPNRQQILNALTMTNSLEMAVMGYGLTDVVKATGAFMILVGFTFIVIAVPAFRRRTQGSQ